MPDVKGRIKLRSGTAAEWESANPILLNGEPGYEEDTGAFRIGDGLTNFVDLPDRTGIPRDRDETLEGGYTAIADDGGTIGAGGTYQPEPAGGNFKSIINGGAFTLAAPVTANNFTMIVSITNGPSAGAVTFTGFNAVIGDGVSTTNGETFIVFITKIAGVVIANVAAAQ